MSKKQKSYFVEAVEKRGVRIPIYCAPVGEYDSFLISYPQAGRRKQERAKTLEAARKRANEVVDEVAGGQIHIGTLNTKDLATITEALSILKSGGGKIGLLEAVRQFSEAQKILGDKATVPHACREFIKELERGKLPEISFPKLVELFLTFIKKEKSRRYNLDMQARLRAAAKIFTGSIADVKTAEIDSWLSGMEMLSGRTKNNYRNAVRTLFRYGREKNYLPRQEKTEVEFSSRYSPPKTEIGIYTPEQLELLLTRISPRMLPVIAIGALAGLRSAEISRLEWKHIRFESEKILVPVAIAKTSNNRFAPITPALAAWIKPFRRDAGKVLVRVQDEFSLATVFKKAVDAIQDADGNPMIKIVPNGLRHSFISYRVALLKNVHEVSLEAGNSPRVIFSNYRALVEDENLGEKWFGILPTKARLKEIKDAIEAGL